MGEVDVMMVFDDTSRGYILGSGLVSIISTISIFIYIS